MKRITDMLAKEIVAVTEGESAGVVISAFTDEKLSRIRGYKVANDEEDAAGILPLRRVLGEGDALTVKTRLALKPAVFPECPLGAKVYDTCGVLLGRLRDVLFDERTGQVLSLAVDQNEFSPSRVLSFGKTTLVLRAPAHENTLFKKTSKRAAPKPQSAVFDIAVEPLPDEAKESAVASEKTFLQDYAFLLGRTVRKTILNGETVVAEEGSPVTPEAVLRARENGKLVELTVNSRKG